MMLIRTLKLLSVSFVVFYATSQAQTPQGFMYQALVQESNGNPIRNKELDIKVSLIQNSLEGEVIYSEIHRLFSSKNGTITLTVGEGGFNSGDFAKINWSHYPLYIRVEIKYDSNTTYEIISASKIMSVPFALHSKYSENGLTDREQNIIGKKKFSNGLEGTLTGGVVLNNTGPTKPGSIRWTGTDFVGFNGTEWISLTAGGGIIAEDSTNWSCGDNFIDDRNNMEYRTTQIGNQCWMRDNLNYDSGPESFAGSGNYSPESAGRYYTWAGAMNIDGEYNEEIYDGSQVDVTGACPSGWHLPSHEEWNLLELQEGVTGITLQEGGQVQFDAKLVGDRLENGEFANFGISAIFWSSTQVSGADAYKRILFDGEEGIGVFIFDKSPGFSIRCIKN